MILLVMFPHHQVTIGTHIYNLIVNSMTCVIKNKPMYKNFIFRKQQILRSLCLYFGIQYRLLVTSRTLQCLLKSNITIIQGSQIVICHILGLDIICLTYVSSVISVIPCFFFPANYEMEPPNKKRHRVFVHTLSKLDS